MKIRKLNNSDLEKIRFLQPEGWEDITFHFRFFINVHFCFPVVAEIDNKIVGMANCLLNKGTGWISHIIVANDFRNQGIGYKLTKHVMNILNDNHCSSQLLIATKMGENLYKKLGFKKSTIYNFYIGERLSFLKNENIRQLKKSDYNSIYDLDKSISGENRRHMIKHFISAGYVFENKPFGEISGYFLPHLGDGVILASSDIAGIELLKLKHSLKNCKSVLPENNLTGNKFLKDQRFELQNQAYRMIYGEEINWKPKSVFCRIGGYYA